MALAPHTKANREFFESGCAPHVSVWLDWIERGVVDGKIIDGKPYVDLNHFAAQRKMSEPVRTENRIHGADLLKRRKVG
jgi:putative intracellular protease/amidase